MATTRGVKPNYLGKLRGKHFLNTNDFSQREISDILRAARDLRAKYRARSPTNYLPGSTLFMLFYNRSLRTRNSFEAGIYQLGGHAHFLSPSDVYTPTLPEDMIPYQTESVADVARVLSTYGDAIAIRIYGDAAKWHIGRGHRVIREFARWSKIPILNMEDDIYHPFQALADMMAITDSAPKPQGKKFVVSYAYSGGLKPLAVPQSCILIGTQFGMDVVLAHPPGFELEEHVLKACTDNVEKYGGSFTVSNDMREAFEGADFVYPKAWSPKGFFPPYSNSMNKDGAASYQDKYRDWICTPDLMDLTNKGKYMHCGPADRGQEVVDEVIDNPTYSLYFQQAENRLHVQKAVMCMTMGRRR
ncbi:MAG: ornithine carbamoyltransferase [Nitrososphaerota archaeon]